MLNEQQHPFHSLAFHPFKVGLLSSLVTIITLPKKCYINFLPYQLDLKAKQRRKRRKNREKTQTSCTKLCYERNINSQATLLAQLLLLLLLYKTTWRRQFKFNCRKFTHTATNFAYKLLILESKEHNNYCSSSSGSINRISVKKITEWLVVTMLRDFIKVIAKKKTKIFNCFFFLIKIITEFNYNKLN